MFSWTLLVIKLILPLSRFMISSYSLDEVHVWFDWMLWSINEDDQLIYLEDNQIWCHNSRIYGFLRELSVVYGVFGWWHWHSHSLENDISFGWWHWHSHSLENDISAPWDVTKVIRRKKKIWIFFSRSSLSPLQK